MLKFGMFAVLLGATTCVAAAPRIDVAELSVRKAPVESFRLDGLQRGAAASTWLDLRPAQAFSADARLVVVGPDGERDMPLPALRHFIGTERGDADSRVFLSVAGDGSIRGWLRRGEVIEAFSRQPGDRSDAALELLRVDLHAADVPERGFSCGTDELAPVPAASGGDHDVAAAPAGSPGAPLKLARVAIDTDDLYLNLFGGDNISAARYAADLIGYSSAQYIDEVGYGMTISYLRLWASGTSPWQQTSSSCLLYEFGKHWNDNMTGVERTIAHFLSGRGGIGGIAWVGVLCRSPFNYTVSCGALSGSLNVGGDYGFTGSISGSFNPGAPQVVWDLFAVTHEIGHNFSSPHTHCYGGIPNPGLPPIDLCASQNAAGCNTGAVSLPGPQGAGSGTIMSYCHQHPGGYSNITFNFGKNHPYGDQPERVPSRMAAHALAMDTANPMCFAIDDSIFANGFQ